MSNLIPVRGRFIPGAPDGSISDEDLAAINATVSKPFTASDMYAFACVMATNELTSYGTRLGTSSLNNFASDAGNGIPYLLDHNPDGGIYGYTFTSKYDPSNNQALAGVFIPVGRKPGGYSRKTSDQEIADIAAGMRREVSVGFGGALIEWRCDLCGNDVFSFDCPHLPGMRFDGQLATATIENARLSELSGVYRGACPGAVIGKSEQMFAASRFSAKEYRGWLDRLEVPDATRFISLPSNSPDPGMKERKPMTFWEELLARANGTYQEPNPSGGGAPPAQLPQTHPVLSTALSAGITTPEQFAELKTKAEQFDSVKDKAAAYDATIATQRADAKKLLVSVYSDATERAAQEAVIDTLPAGTALDTYAAMIQGKYDEKLGTSGNKPATRLSMAPSASPASIAQELSVEERQKIADEVSASFDATHGPKKG